MLSSVYVTAIAYSFEFFRNLRLLLYGRIVVKPAADAAVSVAINRHNLPQYLPP